MDNLVIHVGMVHDKLEQQELPPGASALIARKVKKATSALSASEKLIDRNMTSVEKAAPVSPACKRAQGRIRKKSGC